VLNRSLWTTPDQLENASAIILLGVGSIEHGVSKLNSFRSALVKRVLHDKVPFMGIV